MDFLTRELSTRAIRVIRLYLSIYLWHVRGQISMQAHTHKKLQCKWGKLCIDSAAQGGRWAGCDVLFFTPCKHKRFKTVWLNLPEMLLFFHVLVTLNSFAASTYCFTLYKPWSQTHCGGATRPWLSLYQFIVRYCRRSKAILHNNEDIGQENVFYKTH